MAKENLIVSIWKKDEFANDIAKCAGQKQEMSRLMQSRAYTNQEYNPTFQQIDPSDIRKGFAAKENNIFIIAANNPIEGYSPQETFARTLLAANSAKGSGAKEVIIVLPDLLYGRADRSSDEDPYSMGGKSFSLEVIAKSYYASGIDRILTLHPHSKQTEEIFAKAYSKESSKVISILNPVPVIAHYFISKKLISIEENGKNAVLLVPDKGAVQINEELFNLLSLDGLFIAYCNKKRIKPNDPNSVLVDLNTDADFFYGKDVFFVDDGIDTCGTLAKTFEKVNNARKRVAYSTHAWLSGNLPNDSAQDLMIRSNIDLFVLGNTHPDRIHTINDDLLNNKVVFIDYARYFADAIVNCISKGKNVKEHYSFKSLEELMPKAKLLYGVIDKRTSK